MVHFPTLSRHVQHRRASGEADPGVTKCSVYRAFRAHGRSAGTQIIDFLKLLRHLTRNKAYGRSAGTQITYFHKLLTHISIRRIFQSVLQMSWSISLRFQSIFSLDEQVEKSTQVSQNAAYTMLSAPTAVQPAHKLPISLSF